MNTFAQLAKLSDLPPVTHEHGWIITGCTEKPLEVLGHLGNAWEAESGILQLKSPCNEEQAKLERNALAFLLKNPKLKLFKQIIQ